MQTTGKPHSHTHSYCHTHRNSYGDCNSNCDTYSYGELHAQADSYAESSADAQNAPVVSSDFPLAVGPTIKNARIQSDSVSKKVGHASRLP